VAFDLDNPLPMRRWLEAGRKSGPCLAGKIDARAEAAVFPAVTNRRPASAPHNPVRRSD